MTAAIWCRRSVAGAIFVSAGMVMNGQLKPPPSCANSGRPNEAAHPPASGRAGGPLPKPNTYRDFRAKPWIRGEGATFWTPERLAELAATNAAIRNERRKK